MSLKNSRGRSLVLVAWRVCIFLSFAVLLWGGEMAAAQTISQPLMRLYFIPFDVSTYAPVTKNDIEAQSFYAIWFCETSPPSRQRRHPFIAELKGLLVARPTRASLNEGFIRAKVQLNDATFYVDNRGIVLDGQTGQRFILSKSEMRSLEEEVEHFAGVVDVKASKGLPPHR